MFHYIIKRLLLIIPTMLGILLLNFMVVQFVPGGPVEQIIAKLTQSDVGATARFSGGGSALSGRSTSNIVGQSGQSKYRGAQGLEPELIAELEEFYGFNKPAYERFFDMLVNYIQFDFGDSFYKDRAVVSLIVEKMPVSISLGLWTTLLVYLISIPLGIRKAVREGSFFDAMSSTVVSIGYAIPGFMFGILLIVLFAGGSYLQWFPLRGLTSNNFDELSFFGKIADYFWHIALPVCAMVISGFATLTMLTRNSFLEEISKQYVLTAKSKGVPEKRVLYGHIFRNAMLIIVAGFPAAFIGILFTGSFLIETIFSLDGLGLLGFEAIMQRDYPVVLGTLFIFSLIGLVLRLLGDILYMVVDPRIDFNSRG